MQTGSSSFQAEVGKFRFLNELIRLVSPNCNGLHTPELIKNKIVELLSLWSAQFPNEIKIQDALDMLKKQGIVKVSHITYFKYSSIKSLVKDSWLIVIIFQYRIPYLKKYHH